MNQAVVRQPYIIKPLITSTALKKEEEEEETRLQLLNKAEIITCPVKSTAIK